MRKVVNMKKVFSVFLILLCLLLLAAAQAERDPWTCPECGQAGNTGNFCGNCGTKAPEPGPWTCPECGQTGNTGKYCGNCGTKAPGSGTAATPIPAATVTPTEVPAPARTFELSPSFISENGRVTVSWTDSEFQAPYKVLAQYQGSYDVVQPNYIEGEDIYATNFTIEDLVPGKTYVVEVRDAYGVSAKRTYTLPEPTTFEDGKLKASSIKVTIEFRRKTPDEERKNAKKINALVASEIVNNRGTYAYGFRYNIKNPSLAKSRNYFTQVAIIAPNGYTECEVYRDMEYGREYSANYWYMLGDWTFDMIYQKNGSLPTGTWTVELYWDGQYVNTSTFTIK